MKHLNSFHIFKLNENPDYLGKKYPRESLPFSYYRNKKGKQEFFIGDKISWYEIDKYGDNEEHIYTHERLRDDNKKHIRGIYILGRGKLSGRLYVKSKIISFWDFPKDNNELKTISNDIKNKLNINIFDDGWRIEIPKNFLYMLKKHTHLLSKISDLFKIRNWENSGNEILIPTKDYYGLNIQKRKEEDLSTIHTTSPLLKKSKNIPSGVGSMKKKQKYWEY